MRPRAVVRTQAPEPAPAWTVAFLDAIRAEIRAEIRAQLAARPSAIDGDAAVGKAIAELALTRPYSTLDLFELRSTDLALKQALAAALVDDTAQLGALLGRLYKRALIDREPRRGSGGWRWFVRV